ncbi:hypothetical protein ML462_13915 [Gramella lutea]|uniref:AAA+ ATPase domain-containing protein n=1 Tax=Christiangramia lutea TaxID=1607951 RepID=A0A9X1V503_9FLAO|nr:hypothetical protein [Christiangramia lutea]MCH4824268.1 hypothetical protein [Christiangramia lutea]
MPLKRAISVDEMYKMKFEEMPFEGEWLESFGKPERSGVWIIWGQSGNGKTDFAIKTAKNLTKFGRVAYNTLEEGARKSFQLACKRNHMHHVKGKFIILQEGIEDLEKRLNKRKAPNVVIIDSFQYTGLTKTEYKRLKAKYPKTLFIFISHAEGKQPEGRAAKFVRYDADVKIRVEGYRAYVTSRYGGGEPFTIWAEGAAEASADIKP